VLEQRVPERADFVHTMEAQHQRISELIEAAKAQAGPWMGTGSAAMAAELAATVTELDERMVEHLSIEEAEVLPLVVQHMTQEEFTAIGEHSRDSLTQDQLAVGLGLVLDDTSPELGEVLLSNMPPEARAGFEQFGMPLYVQYRARLNGAA
jgi:iron-sulfur cluster repair protein YtfE (RIC family)